MQIHHGQWTMDNGEYGNDVMRNYTGVWINVSLCNKLFNCKWKMDNVEEERKEKQEIYMLQVCNL